MQIKKSSLDTIREYFESDRVSQSELKKYAKSLNEIKYEAEKENESRLLFAEDEQYNIIGSAVDTLLTGTREDFNTLYHVSSSGKPSDLIASILKQVLSLVREHEKELDALVFFRDEILTAVNAHEYQSRWKDETRVDKIIELGADYFEELKLSVNKTVLSAEDMQLVENIVRSFEATYPKLFREGILSDDYEIYHQLPLYWTEYTLSDVETKCKALLDIVIFKKSTNEAIIYDIKTTAGIAEDFQHSVSKYRYDIQAAWYAHAISMNYPVQPENIKFKFLVQSKLYVGKPVEFVATPEFIEKALNGVPERKTVEAAADGTLHGFTKRAIPGIKSLLNVRNYYMSTEFSHDYAGSSIELH